MGVSLREARDSDIEHLLSLQLQLARQERALDPTVKDPDTIVEDYKDYFDALYIDDATQFFVAEVDGVVVGFIVGKLVEMTTIHTQQRQGFICDCYVADDFRKRKIGSQLVTHLEEWFADQDIGIIRLEVYEKNNLGNEFWDAMGYANYYVCKQKILHEE